VSLCPFGRGKLWAMPAKAPLTLMAVHAHPDDESSSTGGVLARYASEGIRTVVVTCTNGEYGDLPGGIKPGEDAHDIELVVKTRLAELEVACQHLSVSHLELLGYHDSGMADWEYKGRDEAFCNVPLEESAARVADLFDKYQPQVVITYDDNGGYNHPDHLRAHAVTAAAIERNPIPSKLYLTARRRRDWEKLRSVLQEQGVEMPAPPQPSPERIKRMEEREALITTDVDTTAFADAKRAALAAHASQLDQSWWLRFPPETFGMIFGQETFIRSMDKTGAPTPEDDLFAGLR
jgi:LmbE family N-acetylglucosaminyl deacetylase